IAWVLTKTPRDSIFYEVAAAWQSWSPAIKLCTKQCLPPVTITLEIDRVRDRGVVVSGPFENDACVVFAGILDDALRLRISQMATGPRCRRSVRLVGIVD